MWFIQWCGTIVHCALQHTDNLPKLALLATRNVPWPPLCTITPQQQLFMGQMTVNVILHSLWRKKGSWTKLEWILSLIIFLSVFTHGCPSALCAFTPNVWLQTSFQVLLQSLPATHVQFKDTVHTSTEVSPPDIFPMRWIWNPTRPHVIRLPITAHLTHQATTGRHLVRV